MTPATFSAAHILLGDDQPEFLLLPAHRNELGVVTTCWELSPEELRAILKTKRIWVQVWTDGYSIQPQLLRVDCPV